MRSIALLTLMILGGCSDTGEAVFIDRGVAIDAHADISGSDSAHDATADRGADDATPAKDGGADIGQQDLGRADTGHGDIGRADAGHLDIGADVGRELGIDGIGVDIGVDIAADIGVDIAVDVGRDVGRDLGTPDVEPRADGGADLDEPDSSPPDLGQDTRADVGSDASVTPPPFPLTPLIHLDASAIPSVNIAGGVWSSQSGAAVDAVFHNPNSKAITHDTTPGKEHVTFGTAGATVYATTAQGMPATLSSFTYFIVGGPYDDWHVRFLSLSAADKEDYSYDASGIWARQQRVRFTGPGGPYDLFTTGANYFIGPDKAMATISFNRTRLRMAKNLDALGETVFADNGDVASANFCANGRLDENSTPKDIDRGFRINELLLFDRELSDTEIAGIRSYLAAKWGI